MAQTSGEVKLLVIPVGHSDDDPVEHRKDGPGPSGGQYRISRRSESAEPKQWQVGVAVIFLT